MVIVITTTSTSIIDNKEAINEVEFDRYIATAHQVDITNTSTHTCITSIENIGIANSIIMIFLILHEASKNKIKDFPLTHSNFRLKSK